MNFFDDFNTIFRESLNSMDNKWTDIDGKDSRIGLDNLGNTCYLNAVVQCLSNTDLLRQYFFSDKCEEDLTTSDGMIAYAFSRLIRQLWTTEDPKRTARSVRPTQLKSLCDRWSALSWGQNDAHEFLALLVDAIHADLNRVRVKRAITRTTDENDNRLDANTLAIQSWNEFQRNNDSIITDLFYGQYVSSIHCTVCPKVSLKFDPFVYLSLPIPIKHTDIHLTDCLRLYTAPEYLSHSNSWYCPKCKTNREARKQIHFWRLPHVVIIQLKRFCFDVNSCPEKITGFVDFPLYLNLDSGMTDSLGRKSSMLEMRHQLVMPLHLPPVMWRKTSLRLQFKGLGWRRFDDNRVDDIREDYVITRNAYILFYKRKEYKSNL
ncbi:unnamed protein product [Oppiella nova]|uniref:ubiquitinyl hydrolase 1 n=1 Tax=Oppiella nova TaxID=334625 RepID=A0A7R9LQU8_9ACAR|nr:unnamed protein product [Oppiella nova]CAG2166059.1 unnamed protein product [Oppiella nova]